MAGKEPVQLNDKETTQIKMYKGNEEVVLHRRSMRGLSVYEWCLTSLVIRETQKHNKMPLQTYKDAQNVKVTVIVMMAAEK